MGGDLKVRDPTLADGFVFVQTAMKVRFWAAGLAVRGSAVAAVPGLFPWLVPPARPGTKPLPSRPQTQF
jgi:hypothetical protein